MAASAIAAWASSYGDVGWRVFPATPDKRPTFRDWQHVATTDAATIGRWWPSNEWTANVAVVTGEAFDCFEVVGPVEMDVEAAHVLVLRAKMRAGGYSLPFTPIARRGRGGIHATIVNRIRDLDVEDGELRFVVAAEALGGALWRALGSPQDAERWQLYAGRGLERQGLVDTLLVAIHEGRFHFAPGLAEQEAMGKALVAYNRQVREDGAVGSELVFALLLALIPAPVLIVPFAVWA